MLSLDDIRELAPKARNEAALLYPDNAEKALTFFFGAVGLLETRPTDEDIAWAVQQFRNHNA